MLLIDDTRREAMTAELPGTAAADDGAPDGEPGSPRARRRHSGSRIGPVLAMGAGLLVTAVASLGVVHHGSDDPREAGAGTRPPVPAPAFQGVVVGGPADVTVQMATYEPDHSSGWHAHTGMHAVMVLSGTVTFYDGDCQPRTYGPGDTYVGGHDVHLARNETAAPVELAVTYMFPAGVDHTRFHVPTPAPVGCDTT